MKTLIASMFALALLSAGAASAEVGAGAHVGPVGVGAGAGSGGVGAGAHVGPVGVGAGIHGHHRHCASWGRHHHNCRRWG
jgi:hypothetical protein